MIDVVQSHSSIGFDRTGILQDLNIALPVDRLRELRDAGEIGSLAPTAYSFLGSIRPPFPRLMEETGPAVAAQLKADGVDVVVLTPV